MDSAEFTALRGGISSSAQSSWNFGGNSPSGSGPSQDQVQNQLNQGGVLDLSPETVVRLTHTLTIPATSILRTTQMSSEAGLPRIVRDEPGSWPLVVCYGTMQGMWLDGESGQWGTDVASDAADLITYGATVTNCVMSDQVGPTAVSVGDQFVHPRGDVFTHNLITQYTLAHDEIQVCSPDAVVYGNSVVDASGQLTTLTAW